MGKTGIGKINYSEVCIYYPIQYESKLDFKKIIKLLNKSSVCITNHYVDSICRAFNDKILSDLDERKKLDEKLKEDDISIKTSIKKLHSKNICDLLKGKLVFGDILCEKNELYLNSSLYNEIMFNQELINRNQIISSNLVGDLYNVIQKRMLLLPIEIILKDGNSQIVVPELIIFTNSTIFIKLTISFCDVEVEHYYKDYINDSISQIEILNLKDVIIKNTIDETIDYFIERLSKDLRIKYFKDTVFKNIEFIDYEGMPENFENVSDSLKRDCYFITSAPVPNRENFDFTNIAKDYYDKQSHNMDNQICYILKSNGGSLLLNSKSMISSHLDQVKEKDKKGILRYIAADLSVNTEFAILVNMMKHLNDNTYFLNRINKSKLKSKKKKYYENKIIINQLMRYCYGTVISQIESFENKMYLYHHSKSYKEKSISIDKLIEMDEAEKTAKYQNYISLMGILLVVLLGLPSIYETLVIIKVNLFNIDLIPFFNLSQISIIIWILSILFLIVIYLIKRVK